MRVDKISLRNFRGLRELDLEFPRQLTVFVGTNGVGKTTVLDAIATMIARLPEKIMTLEPLRWLGTPDIKNDEKELSLGITTSFGPEHVTWSMTIARLLNRVDATHRDAEVTAFAQRLLDRFKEDPRTPMPLAIYFPTTRTELDIPDRIRTQHEFDQFGALDCALSDHETTFRLFFEWFRGREDLENEQLRRGGTDRDAQLDAVRAATAQLLPGYSDLRIERQGQQRMTLTKGGVALSVAQLSDGERCTLALAGDIARRLAIAHPASATPLAEEAVVIIDEVELHLHPGWQREIVPALLRAFPAVQFFLSTHSPQVLSEVHPDDVVLLELDARGDVVASRVESTLGQTSDRILEDVLGVSAQPERVRAELTACFDLIDAGRLDEARVSLGQLAAEIGASTPELARADMLLRRKEILQRAPH